MKKNVLASFVFQGLTVFVQFLMVPLTLNYLKSDKYGIWLALNSFVLWFSFFDLGLTNGLKNKLAETLANKEYKIAKVYVSTTYALLTIIVLFLTVVFLVVYPLVDWSKVFNANQNLRHELNTLIFAVILIFFFKFIFYNITAVFISDQKSGVINFLSFLSNVIAFIAVYIITKTSQDSLLLLGIWISLPAALVPFVASVYSFKKIYKQISPSFKSVDFKKIKPLIQVSVYFFVSQLMTLIIYSSDSMIILQLLGPDEVTVYNISYKYFGVVSMVFGVVASPLWSAFTNAYTQNDFNWIKLTIRKFIRVWLITMIGIIVMILSSTFVYKIWIGNSIDIPISLTVLMGLFVAQNTWVIIFTYFVGGIGKMKLITIIHVFAGIMNIPLSIFFIQYLEMGSSGVILATILCLLPQSILIPIQYNKIVSKTAKGIWNN